MVVAGNEKEISGKKIIHGERHSELLIPGIEEVLKISGISRQDLLAVGVGRGPGSFTGIRIGISTGITISQILNIPLYGISSMDIAGKRNRHPVIKAFRDKYYYAGYDEAGIRETPYMIIDEQEKEKLGGIPVDMSEKSFLKEIDNMYKNNTDGDWRNIEPIYVMKTVYKTKNWEL